MTLTLRREDLSATRTIGRLYVEDAFACFTLEDPVRDGPKVMHETAIPVGRYRVTITKSRRFGVMLPLLLDVPEFTGIRIHAGNTAEDTSGCVLVGLSRSHDSILSSRLALAALQPQIAGAIVRGQQVWVDVRNPLPEGTVRA